VPGVICKDGTLFADSCFKLWPGMIVHPRCPPGQVHPIGAGASPLPPLPPDRGGGAFAGERGARGHRV
jgi:hypothetical protein